MKPSIIRAKSFLFAVRVVRLKKFLANERQEFDLSRQLLRSGTSIGANVREALNAVSTADFLNKLGIAQKECDESLYWIELLRTTDYLTEEEYQSLQHDADELLKILRSIILTTRRNEIEKKPQTKQSSSSAKPPS